MKVTIALQGLAQEQVGTDQFFDVQYHINKDKSLRFR